MRWIWFIAGTAGCTLEPAWVLEPPEAPEVLRFGFPIADRWVISRRIGVDHDPADGGTGLVGDATCVDYLGRSFPYCYDQHDGSDFILDGGFDAMDEGSVAIVAAADGVVVDTEDGHYDRCHTEDAQVSCDGGPLVANQVTLEHFDGSRTLYWHMMKDSVAVEVGDEVRCGDVLGIVGSSGNSSMPHLHFEVHTPDGDSFDPYAGPYSQEESFWYEQGPAEGLPGSGCTGIDDSL
ncbi:MAG: M23 family metallopeptidase [Myxococcales bacterium]|nr:M23 family metallopeptidase [Myxococcales bacterium]